jgi:3-deoxy-D-manno-octulosonate 8-phosphate phosphatase (KDO 8-P phosphatase)
MSNYKEGLSQVKAFIFDVDGVLGSDKVLLFPEGDLLRTMNIKDGFAMQYAIKKGYKMAIITGGNSESVRTRFKNLGVSDVYLKSQNKMVDYEDFKQKHNLSDAEILYMGDDLPDYKVMQKVGVPTCPKNAANEICSVSKYISDRSGGEGAVRDVIEQVLKVQGKWMDDDIILSW